MGNENVLNQLKNTYPALRYFTIENNNLILKYNGEFIITLYNVQLSSLNENLFLLNPIEIFQIIYMLELIYKPTINESEQKFIQEYVQKYLNLNQNALENNNDKEYTNRVWCLSIPIYTSYDPTLINNQSSTIIQELINQDTEEYTSGKGKGQRLVLTNPNFQSEFSEEDNLLNDFERAGFTTIFLIAIAVIATCLFIAFFIFNK